MKRARRTDRNHAAVRDRYRAFGWRVIDTSGVGDGFPDLIAVKSGRIEFIEVKDGTKAPSRQQLTADEARVHALFKAGGMAIRIVTSVEQVRE